MDYLTGKITNPEAFNLDNFFTTSEFMDGYEEILRIGLVRFTRIFATTDCRENNKLVLQFVAYEDHKNFIELYEIMSINQIRRNNSLEITYALYVPK